MIGRTDVFNDATCLACNGTGRDRKKRSRKCPDCFGDGKALVCRTCGERMPCSGTRSDIMDQGVCMKVIG